MLKLSIIRGYIYFINAWLWFIFNNSTYVYSRTLNNLRLITRIYEWFIPYNMSFFLLLFLNHLRHRNNFLFSLIYIYWRTCLGGPWGFTGIYWLLIYSSFWSCCNEGGPMWGISKLNLRNALLYFELGNLEKTWRVRWEIGWRFMPYSSHSNCLIL